MPDLPHPENPGKTHWEGCWRHRGHHNCAVETVDELAAALKVTADALMRVTDCFDDAITASDWKHETKMSATNVVYESRSIETRARRILASARAEDKET